MNDGEGVLSIQLANLVAKTPVEVGAVVDNGAGRVHHHDRISVVLNQRAEPRIVHSLGNAGGWLPFVIVNSFHGTHSHKSPSS